MMAALKVTFQVRRRVVVLHDRTTELSTHFESDILHFRQGNVNDEEDTTGERTFKAALGQSVLCSLL